MNAALKTFNTFDPFAIGFRDIFDRLERATTNATSYPPYNLVKTGDTTYRVEVAIAGYGEEDIEVTVKENTLTIASAKVEEKTEEGEFLHRGIAKRAFRREFTLADTVEVVGAELKNGVLTIQLENRVPERAKERRIPLNGATDTAQLLNETK